jgi:hypothetical protein
MHPENKLESGLINRNCSPRDYLPVKLYIMKKLFLAGAIGLSIAALASTQQSQNGSSSFQGNNQTLSSYRDTIPKRDTSKWPKDTLPRRDSINLQ